MNPRSPSLKPALRALALFPRFNRWAATTVQARHLGRGLSLRQLGALAAIQSGVTSPGQIAKRLLVTPAVVTGLLDRLERHGYVVRREAASGDRRRQHLALTSAGQAVRQEVQEALALELATQFEDATAAELSELGRALDRIERALGALEMRTGSEEEGEPKTEKAAKAIKPGRPKRRRPGATTRKS